MKKAIILTLFLASMLSMAFNVVSVAAISDSWQIGDFEPLGGWPGVVDEFAMDWTTGDTYEFTIGDAWSNFPGVIGVDDEVNIHFDIITTGWYQFVFVRAGGETNTIEVDGISRWYVFATIEGADYDPAPLFETYINLHLAAGPHIITIYQDPDTKPDYADGFFAIDALALIPMPDWDDPHFDLNLQLGPGGYDTSGDLS